MVRVYCDGCFDLIHFGHANQLRQAKCMGRFLVAGVHSDEQIKFNKRIPIFSEEERYELIRDIKWVDDVVEGAPYTATAELLLQLGCDFIVHGNDISVLSDGTDCYKGLKDIGMYKESTRTPNVSTTDLINRILTLNTGKVGDQISPWTKCVNQEYLDSLYSIFNKSNDPTPQDKIIYVAGTFDIFNIGHLKFLKAAKSLGTYLIVGIYSDEDVEKEKGSSFPLISLFERALTVLSYKVCNRVIQSPPLQITKEFIEANKIGVVVEGTVKRTEVNLEAAKEIGCYQQIESGSLITTATIIQRIIESSDYYEQGNRSKQQKEVDHIEKHQ
uniref:Ethanolamine-phosphate cytidylyltransferase n=1 Tax=Rhabditophanes sp. KR3021 TaxID=114890 RepID=A0AC35UC92_9BILA